MSEARKNLKWIAIGFGGLLVAAVAVLLLFIYQADARLELMLAELRAAGEPTTLAELAPKPVPPEDNADTFLRRAEVGVTAIASETDSSTKRRFPVDVGAFNELTDEAQERLRTSLAAHPDVIPLLEQASRCRDYDPGLDYRLPYTEFVGSVDSKIEDDLQPLEDVLHLQVLIQLDDGRRVEALETCLVMLRLARRFDLSLLQFPYQGSLTIREIAVRDMNRVLRSGRLPPVAYDEVELELGRQQVLEVRHRTLVGLRAMLDEAFRDPDTAVSLGWRSQWLPWTVKREECDCLDLLNVAIATPALPYEPWCTAVSEASRSRHADNIVEQVGLGLFETQDSLVGNVALLRALRVLNAIVAKETPESAAPTAETLGLPAEVLVDPFNERPLIIKHLPEGWLVYSVGSDLKDDGGGAIELGNHEDVGVGPPPLASGEPAKENETVGEAPAP